MGKNKKLILNKQKYRETVSSINNSAYKYQNYGHAPSSIGFIAHRMHMRPSSLIAAFAKAGIRGISSNHIVEEEQWKAFFLFYKSLPTAETKEIYQDDSSLDHKILLVQEININLLRELAKRPHLMYELGPRKFEELVAKLLEDQGCEVTLTKRTRDGGYDLFGKMKSGPSNLIFLAECKRFSPTNKVGVEVVRGLYGVTEARRANLGLVITTSSFTKDAIEEKFRIGPRIDLKGYSDLSSWLSEYQIAD